MKYYLGFYLSVNTIYNSNLYMVFIMLLEGILLTNIIIIILLVAKQFKGSNMSEEDKKRILNEIPQTDRFEELFNEQKVYHLSSTEVPNLYEPVNFLGNPNPNNDGLTEYLASRNGDNDKK